MAAAAVSSVPRLTFFANDGTPLNGGNVYTYAAGTLTPKTFYSDEAKSVPVSNPIVINAAGRPQASAIDTTEVNLYFSGSAKFIVKDSNGATLYTSDNVEEVAVASGGTGNTFISPTINTSILSASALLAGICGGRLTLTSGTAVTTGDVTGATTVYFTPYGTGIANGNIGLYDGVGTWTLLPFTEKSVALGTLTSGLPYDIFAYNNGGTVALRAPVAWTSTTARATALVLQNGIYVKSGATTDRYLGTFYTTSTTTTEDSQSKRDLWNYYNRVDRNLVKADATASWTYATSATIRQVRGSSTNQVEFVIGVAEGELEASYADVLTTDNVTIAPMRIGLGLDSVTAFTATQSGNTIVTSSANQMGGTAMLTATPAVGYHYLAMLEAGNASVTTTFFGTGTYNGAATLLARIQG